MRKRPRSTNATAFWFGTREGAYGSVKLDDLSVLALGYFKGNIWAGAKAKIGIFIDERADEQQRGALQAIFGGQAGGWPGLFAQNVAEVRGIEFAKIEFDIAGALSSWRASILGCIAAAQARRCSMKRALPASQSSRGCSTGSSGASSSY